MLTTMRYMRLAGCGGAGLGLFFVFCLAGCGDIKEPTGPTGPTDPRTPTASKGCSNRPPDSGSITIAGANSMGFGTSPAKMYTSTINNRSTVTWSGGFEGRKVNGTTYCLATGSLEIAGMQELAQGKSYQVTSPTRPEQTFGIAEIPDGANPKEYVTSYVYERVTEEEKTALASSRKVSYRAVSGTVTVQSLTAETVTLKINISYKKVEEGALTGDAIEVTGEISFDAN